MTRRRPPARPFVDRGEGQTVQQAWDEAIMLGRLMDRIGGYESFIVRKPGYVVVEPPPYLLDDGLRVLNLVILTSLDVVPRIDVAGVEMMDFDHYLSDYEFIIENSVGVLNSSQLEAAQLLVDWVEDCGPQDVMLTVAHYCDVTGNCLAVNSGSVVDHDRVDGTDLWWFTGLVEWSVRHPSRNRTGLT